MKKSYENLPKYIADTYGDRILLLPRAIKELKKAPQFRDVSLVYQAIDLLGTSYYNLCTGKERAEAFQQKMQELHLYLNGYTKTKPTVRCEQYKHMYKNNCYFMNKHLCHGKDHNPQKTLRIYFTYDELLSKILIGSLPGHLVTGQS